MGLTSQAVNAKKVMSVKILKSFAGKKKEGLRRQNPEDPLQKRILRNVVAQTLKLLSNFLGRLRFVATSFLRLVV